jgi:1-aminocyclopropane-1-carboxylate deaminase/D-cysteine desulfhydrase-like pyridoxal-dependent ACC family enzyme
LGWICIDNYIKNTNIETYKILYIHQGGIIGNASMKERYLHKYN